MACLSKETLSALPAGKLSGDAVAAAFAHLDVCTLCARALARELSLSMTDTVTTPLSGAEPEALPDEVSRYAQVRDGDGAEVELGRGGIGRVVLVEDARLGRNVAMKLLLKVRDERDPEQTSAVRARFLREARVTGQLEHPAIVPVHDVGQRPDGSLYYTMRRIRGRTLARAITEASTLEQRLALMPHVLAACQALAFAHSRRVVHRDVKPQNVMLDRYGQTYVVDWGLARVLGVEDGGPPVQATPPPTPQMTGAVRAPDLTSGTGVAVVGTPAYMAPEQLEGRIGEVDERTDVWGLGCILYEVLTGTLPRMMLSKPGEPTRFGPVQPVLDIEPRAPKELAAVCAKALQEAPAQRYSSAERLAEDVDAWMSGRPVAAYEYRPWDLLKRFATRFRAPLVVAAAAVVALVALGVASVRRVRAERDDARQLARMVLGDVGRELEPVPGSLPVVQAVTTRALEFYRRVGAEEGLSPEDREDMGWAVLRLLQTNQKLGRNAEARRLGALCNQIAGRPEGVARTRPELLAVSVGCENGLATLAMLEGDDAGADAHLAEAQRRVALGQPGWDSDGWLTAQSVLASRLFHRAYLRNQLADAQRYAEQGVTLDERSLRSHPGDRRRTVALARSLLDAELVTTYVKGVDAALPYGERSLKLLRELPHSDENVNVISAIASAATQHHQILATIARDDAAAKPVFEQAKRAYHQLIYLEPDVVESRCDFGALLLRGNDVPGAWEQMQRVIDLGAGGDCEALYAEVALLTGKPELVVARRKTLETSGVHLSRWVLAVALAVTGDLRGGAANARAAMKAEYVVTEWPQGELLRYARTVPGPVGRVVERFAEDYEKQFLSQQDAIEVDTPENDRAWKALFERFAVSLEALEADAGVK